MKRVFVKFQHKKYSAISSMLKRTDLICIRKQRSALDFSGFFKMKRLEPLLRIIFENTLKMFVFH